MKKMILLIQLTRGKQKDRKANISKSFMTSFIYDVIIGHFNFNLFSSIDGTNTEDQRNAAHGNTDRSALIGCRKCGYPGHMTYECRNGVKTGSSSYAMIHCDISSTSSDDEDVRMLRELKGISRVGALKNLNPLAPPLRVMIWAVTFYGFNNNHSSV